MFLAASFVIHFKITDGKFLFNSAVLIFIVLNTGKGVMEDTHESP